MKALRDNSFLCPFQLLEVTCIPWLITPFFIFKASNLASIFKSLLTLTLLFPSFTYKDLWDYSQLIQDNLPISRRISKLNSFCNLTPPWPCHITHSPREEDADILGGGLFCLPQMRYSFQTEQKDRTDAETGKEGLGEHGILRNLDFIYLFFYVSSELSFPVPWLHIIWATC